MNSYGVCVHGTFQQTSAYVNRDSPLRTAAALSLGYVLVCSAYIWLSGNLAAHLAHSVSELQKIELLKGFGFVVVTGLVFFSFSLVLLRRITLSETVILRQKDALMESERRATAGFMASSVAHDINNVLTVLDAHASELSELCGSQGKYAEAATGLSRGIQELHDLAKGLIDIGREGVPGKSCAISLNDLVEEAVRQYARHERVRGRHVDVLKTEVPLVVSGNPHLLRRMVLNLLLNAAEATPSSGTIRFRLGKEDGRAVLEVHDNGPGVALGDRERIFNPFYTTKPNGSGLGLLSVRACAETYGGSVHVQKSDLGGACFRVVLPAVGSQ